jgi:hypothetical protein
MRARVVMTILSLCSNPVSGEDNNCPYGLPEPKIVLGGDQVSTTNPDLTSLPNHAR